MKKIDSKNSSYISFIIIAIFYAIGNFIWWKLNTPVLPEDMAGFHFHDIFFNQLLYYNAPLITWIMKGFFAIFGKEYFDLQIIIVNYIFFLVALYFIYKIGIELKDKETGNIAMILFALTPAVYGMSRQYGHQDWHVMILMVPNIYCLIKLNDFKDRKFSIFYGITVGLGLLMKDEFLPYFFVPWLYVAIRSLIEKIDKNKIINILTTILTGSLIAGCHYFRIEIISKILNEPTNETAPIFCFESLKMTTIDLSEYLLSLPIFILFIIGLIWFIYKYKNKNKWILILWFLIPWLIITFMPHHKEVEYSVGYIPVIILIIALFISGIKKYLIKKIFLIVLALIYFFQFIIISYFYRYDISFRYKQNTITFFNGNLISYDNTNNSFNISLLNHLKKISNGYSLVIPTPFAKKIVSLALINDIDISVTWLDDENILEHDIYIFIGSDSYFLNSIYNSIDFLYGNSNKELCEEKKNKIMENFQKVKDNYYLIDSFYIQNIEDEEHLVRLYKKKTDLL